MRREVINKKKPEPAPAPTHEAPSATAAAQPAGPSDEGVSYSANRTPTEMTKVGSSVEVLTAKDIAAQSRTYVKDYLSELPGVTSSQAGPAGSLTSINIRGADQRYIKVLIDGMDISDPSVTQTAAAFENMLAGDVERIEVVKGSQSTLYGGDAVGGVVAITTKSATLGPSASGMVETGSYNTQRGLATAAYGAPEGYARFTVEEVRSDGFSAADIRNGNSEPDSYRNLTFSGSGDYALSDAVKVFFSARSVEANARFDDGYNFLTGLVADGNPAARQTTELRAGRTGTEVKLFDGAFVNTFAIQGFDNNRQYFGTPAYYLGDRVKADYLGTAKLNDWVSFVVGADYEQDGAENNYQPGVRHEVDLSGLFAQASIQPIQNLTLTVGGRDDQNSAFGEFPTYRVTGAYYIPSTETKFRASNGTGFRAPSLYELYDPIYGNPTLKPEESTSWDAGVDQYFFKGRYRLSATYFELDTTNEIGYDIFFRAIQIPGTTHRSGVELSANVPVNSLLSFYFAYTYTDAQREDGTRLVRIPLNAFAFNVNTLFFDCVKATISTRIALDTQDRYFDPVTYLPKNVPLENYMLLNAKLSYDITPNVTAYVRGENLLNQKYETVLGYGTPGVSAYTGLTFKFGG
jgi:vitamin B12 transporter